MRQASAFMAGAGSVAVLAIGWQVGASALTPPSATPAAQASAAPATTPSATPTPTASPDSNAAGSQDTTAASTPTATPTPAPAATKAASSSSGISGTFHGQDFADDGGYGDIQVDVVFKNGKITAVNSVSCNATGGRARACPMLAQEVVSAQSANVSAIGHATYSSMAYLKSVQSALDAAGFKG
jgi:uncharacterized protein with FMN-binding domain